MRYLDDSGLGGVFVKILFFSQYFFPEPFLNGELAKHLVCRGHEVTAFPCVPNYPSGVFYPGYSNSQRRDEEWNGVKIHRAFTIPRGSSKKQLIANYLLYPLAATWRAIRKGGRGADVSFVSMPSPLLQALAGIIFRWIYKIPTVYWVQDIWPESATYTLGRSKSLLYRPLEWLCGWIYRQADLILVQSAAFIPMIERFGVAGKKIQALPNTASKLYLPRATDEAREEARMMPVGFRLMFAGNIGESQDFETLVAAAALLKERTTLQWIIIGSGRAMQKARDMVEAKGLNESFHFLGRFPEDRMSFFFAHADAMLVSLRDYPIFALTVPSKVQSYMACGKPMIGSLNGEGARIIKAAGAGFSAPASTPTLLAEQVTRMMDLSEEERAAMGRRARAFFEANYDVDVVTGQLEDALNQVIRQDAKGIRSPRKAEASPSSGDIH